MYAVVPLVGAAHNLPHCTYGEIFAVWFSKIMREGTKIGFPPPLTGVDICNQTTVSAPSPDEMLRFS